MEDKSLYEIIISDRARQMLASHISFLAQKSPTAARKKNKELAEAIRSLSALPKRNPFLNTELIPRNKYHKMFVENYYLVLYQIKDQRVYVDYIVDCRQDYEWLIK